VDDTGWDKWVASHQLIELFKVHPTLAIATIQPLPSVFLQFPSQLFEHPHIVGHSVVGIVPPKFLIQFTLLIS